MDITELEEFFKNATLPKELQINKSTRITNVRRMVMVTWRCLSKTGISRLSVPPSDRLLLVKDIIENGL